MMLWYSTSGVLNIGFASILSYPWQENRTTISLIITSHVRDICKFYGSLFYNKIIKTSKNSIIPFSSQQAFAFLSWSSIWGSTSLVLVKMTVRTPGTPASKIERTPATTPNGHRAKEEKIVVTVRLRPLNKRELSAKDHAAWDCVDDHTIIYRPLPHERAAQPASFTFDKVFGPDSITEAVYEEGVKNVALSSLMGINATIFAYGQTSSGKTYTMKGITEKAVNDIYSHIMSTPEREFRIRISGLEIYNENVRDLLNSESGRNLKLLDDPEKGTVVEKLVEETASNDQHLRHLISICEAQRQVGETALNDTSSRSHQIIRLTIESTHRESSDCVRSYVASLNFVDLAGSERASQTNADGARLREGCHINLSLMTLTTVIRKLSCLLQWITYSITAVLQSDWFISISFFLPASSHVEQSRNTLFFATRAKEVTNNAQVNMVVSDKQLVKHLQKEVARLEAELRTPEPANEKDLKIQQMEMEIEELKRQRDLAQSQANELRRKLQEEQGLRPSESVSPIAKKCLSFSGTLSPNFEEKAPVRGERTRNTMGRQSVRQSLAAPFTLMHEIRKLEHLQEQLGDEANRALEVLQKEVACHRLGNQDAAETIAKLQAEIREMRSVPPVRKEVEVGNVVAVNKSVSANLKEEIARLHSQGSNIADLEEQLENVQKSLDKLVMSLPSNNDQQSNNDAPQKAKHPSKKKKLLPLASSNSINRQNFLKSPCSPLSTARQVLDCEIENRAPDSDDLSCEIQMMQDNETPTKSDGGDVSSKEGTPYRRSSSVNMRKMQKMFQDAAEENVRNIRSYVTELKERVAKLQYQKQLLVCQVLELEANEAAGYNLEDDENIHQIPEESPVSWQITFKEQRQQIIDLWDVCYVSIIHRSQFYLLFKGDPADEIYLEVELRRLTWLQQHLAELGNATPARAGNEPTVSLSSSIKALKREREFLAKRLTTRLTAEERDYLYIKWEVPLEGKQRRMQFINKLWTNPRDEKHVKESAEIVAKLVGFCEGGNMSREMFELNFVLPSDRRPWFAGWNQISDLLHI
ncbi:Kinesin-like protein NACK2 [Capsicum baccatum]|uniref:Kinesin-like protein NACK2 n=1 Tax=Capsicum baccatum TaxID=33114 RepID=A0A2G2WQD0_CAPBA|nr:Kinesin-like protein NACK2 [Capsicum baccatum]